jgi:hypothetical protein
MSGHKRGEDSYFVPRALVPLQYSIAWYCTKLLPNLGLWRQQSRSRGGDKSICCDKFLNHVLPYFTEVLIQDGIYFVKDFPNHPISQLLKVRYAGKYSFYVIATRKFSFVPTRTT